MKNTFFTIVITVVVFTVAMNVPAKWFNVQSWFGIKLGTVALTDISSTDNISAFPTVQNANNTIIENALNTIEGTTTNSTITELSGLTTAGSLETVGTITTGTWNGDTIAVANGGTGSTTLSAYQILLGNGTGSLLVVNGLGISGQFLTSAGAGAAPTWTTSSLDTSLNYGWTGNFAIKNLYASSTAANPMVINGVSYVFPSNNSASSTVLMNDGSGNLTWNSPDWIKLGSAIADGSVGTTSVGFSATSTGGRHTKLKIIFTSPQIADAQPLYLRFNGDGSANYGFVYNHLTGNNAHTITVSANATTTVIFPNNVFDTQIDQAFSTIEVDNQTSIRKMGTFSSAKAQSTTGAAAMEQVDGSFIWNNTSAPIESVHITTGGANVIPSGATLTVYGSRD